MTTQTLTLDAPLDMHIHFREGEMLARVAPLSAHGFAGGVIMPNLVPPVDNLERLVAYKTSVQQSIQPHAFEPYMTLFFRDYSEDELRAAKPHIIGVKLYPAGITTNSEGGVDSLSDAEAVMALLEKLEIPLLIHGESSGFVMDREAEFMLTYEIIARQFPNLKIVMEHITTAAALQTLNRFDNLFATVTLQHLIITLDDVAGGLLQPHLFCKPIAKRPEDRDALLAAALAAHPKLSFGSDSAPHPIDKKESAGCAAGVFTAPLALPVLTDLFEQHDRLDNLQAFVSDNAQRIYGVTPPAKRVTLTKTPMTVPFRYGNVVPFMAGRTVNWSISAVT